ncbi:efflux transporter outer membrane subunit [Polymorphobacter fuscus]|uniref:Efflux transporter outer membrane subunit n=1 Tax=Sandarakinorhabdus fusca TaxID=1439888 RepID=A0A7C9GQ29_9SPHN|nr:TolC family protein [Polymorphobacter fuscus]KAB7645519.1 TolC family protein [Polymorphobacter fuscus]MQT17955.1 efflux transporter outer membrane subunit [Polymorphobacter fuscus]NJC08585.1 NodT family efflux transporter outer membrane factor (OMF) lipoprotein [Polymorphobacter fuscus]
MIRSSALIGLLLLSACAIGPDYRPAPVPPAATAPFTTTATPATASGAAVPDAWWRLYADPVLDDLIGQAFVANTDLRVATANLRRARAVLSESRAGRFPTTQISGSAVEARQTVFTANGPVPFESPFYRLGIDASYEIDLYGRVTRQIEASRADADAEAANRDTVAISVAAETARAYADACSGARQLAVAERSLKIQTDSFGLTERRVAAGRDSPLDRARAQAQLEATRATLPTLRANRQSALFRLSVLTGKPPTEIDPRAAACTAPPQLKQPIPTGDGAALLKRRPDVRQADRQLAAATARIGVATADLYPQINLGGSASASGVSPGAAFSNNGFAFSLGPLISWSFPNILVARARINQSKASSEAALANFDGVVLAALNETETSLSDYAGVIDRNRALRAARDQSADAARIVRLRYGAGAENFLAVLDAERTLATADADLASSDAALTTAQIAVFKALGGGWEGVPVDPTRRP